jgi:hypothetical protein
MPAGFTADGLPIGIELLGPAFSESALLARAHAWEQAMSPRRAPFSTPPLVHGKAPAPVVTALTLGAPATAGSPAEASVRLTWDATTGALTYTASTTATDALAIAVHRMDGTRVGPIVAHLLMRGQPSAQGTLTLRGRDREDMAAGRLVARLYTARAPLGSAPVPLAPAAP